MENMSYVNDYIEWINMNWMPNPRWFVETDGSAIKAVADVIVKEV